MRGLTGKVAMVTGAAQGLGLAIARRLADEGAAVLLADISAGLDDAAGTLAGLPGPVAAIRLDVADEPGWASAIATTAQRFGGLDVLVNNAGITVPGHIEDLTLAAFRQVLEVNLIGAFLGMRAAIPALRARGGGSIVNLSSAATRVTMPASLAYAASKSALASLTKTTAIHCARAGYAIRVNSVHPGPHVTPMLEAGIGRLPAEVVEAMHAGIPLGRVGVPEDVAGVVAFLASDDAAYVTAEELFVDGGLSAV